MKAKLWEKERKKLFPIPITVDSNIIPDMVVEWPEVLRCFDVLLMESKP